MAERRLTEAELEASRWIARLEASDVTLDDHDRFRAWLAASEENRLAHEAVSRTWDKLDALKLLGPELLASTSSGAAVAPARAKVSRRGLLIAGGAAVAAGVGGAFWMTPSTTYAATFEAAVGGREQASLQDGSEIELNAATRVEATYTSRRRVVSLERGEALFVVQDDGRPFVVRTAHGDVATRHGRFLVKVGPRAVRVSVLEGVVTTTAGSATASHEVLLASAEVEIEPLAADRAEQRLAWRTGELSFNGETLREAAADVERQTGVRFTFAEDDVADMRVGGLINAADADAFVALCESNLGLKAVTRADRSVEFQR